MALPPVLHRFVRGKTVTVRSVTHSVVGYSDSDNGIVEQSELRKLILQCTVLGTRLNSSVFDLEDPPAIQLDEGKTGSAWKYDDRKESLNWLLPAEYQKNFVGEDLWSITGW